VKRWFLAVDWCGKGRQGIFCDINGNASGKETQHTEDEIWEILGTFTLILNPQSIELSKDELKEYHKFYPLAEYSTQYGIACKE